MSGAMTERAKEGGIFIYFVANVYITGNRTTRYWKDHKL